MMEKKRAKTMKEHTAQPDYNNIVILIVHLQFSHIVQHLISLIR